MNLPERLPAFAELPIKPDYPPHSAWGVFGDDDQIGTLNLLTPERVTAAARLVQTGRVFALNWELNCPIRHCSIARPCATRSTGGAKTSSMTFTTTSIRNHHRSGTA